MGFVFSGRCTRFVTVSIAASSFLRYQWPFPPLVRASNFQFLKEIKPKPILVQLHSALSGKFYRTNRPRLIDIVALNHQSFHGVDLSTFVFNSV